MKKTFFLFFVSLLLYTVNIAQNLVKNPDFEQYKTCPLGIGRFNLYVQNWIGFTDCDASYFHSCGLPPGVSVPLNDFGSQYAHSGKAYACIMVYSIHLDPDRRIYIEDSLKKPLSRDSIYCVSYYTSLADFAGGAIQNVDALLSDTLMNWNNGFPYYLIHVSPQIRSQQVLTDSVGWTRVSGLYKAHGGEQYITIGNFRSNENTNIIKYKYADRVDYYIDDVSVALVSTGLRAPDLGNDTILCRGALPLHMTAPPGYDAYQWSNGATTRETDATDQGKYWVKCIITGCGELYDEKVIAFDTPLLNLGKDTVICKGENIDITAQPGFTNYTWNTGATTQSIKVSAKGVYYLQTLDHCGSQTDTVHVEVDTIPTGIINLGNDTTMCHAGKDVPVVITTNTILPNYMWNTGDTTWQITVAERGMYSLQSRFRCGTVSDSIFVDECPPMVFLPNAFSPNNDGINDVFRAISINTKIDLMVIYDRWGQKIFESSDPSPAWDGTLNNENLPAGLYAYVLYFSDIESSYTVKKKRGTVLLLR